MIGFPALAVALSLAMTTVSAAAETNDMAGLTWLSGCWASMNGEPGSGEYWTPLAGASLLGVSRTVRAGRTVFHEFMRIGPGDDGTVFFTAHPSGQGGARFRLVSSAEQSAVFENPEHDFPQRITYRRVGDRLQARIERIEPGDPKRVDFSMRRISCDPRAIGEAGGETR